MWHINLKEKKETLWQKKILKVNVFAAILISKAGLCWPFIRMHWHTKTPSQNFFFHIYLCGSVQVHIWLSLASFLPLHIICLSCPSDTIPGYEAAGTRLLFFPPCASTANKNTWGCQSWWHKQRLSPDPGRQDWIFGRLLPHLPRSDVWDNVNRICFFCSSLQTDSLLK